MLFDFKCVLIGRGSLLVNCAQQLLDEGRMIVALISSDEGVTSWGVENNIPIIDDRFDIYRETLKSYRFDYLFSIIHLNIIPAEVLAMASKASINYHDALLPRYAGIHATSWAIINQESTHGITWHEMLPNVDEGRVVAQRTVDITEGETAFSLNIKCYAAAIESFGVLISDLAQGAATFTAQDLSLRSYYGKFKRPENMGLVSWDKSAKEVQALIRGLDFGVYENALAKAKLMIDETFYCIDEVVVSTNGSDESPGVIIDISENGMVVSTKTDNLIVTELSDLSGAPVKLSEWVKSNFVGKNLCVDLDSTKQVAYELSARSEPFWLNIFSSFDIAGNFSEFSLGRASATVEWDAPRLLLKELKEFDIQSLFCAFLSRVRKEDQYVLAVDGGELPLDNYYIEQLPFVWSVGARTTYTDLRIELSRQSENIKKNAPCPADIFERYPSIDSQRLDGTQYKYELSLAIEGGADEGKKYSPLVASYAMCLVLDARAEKWCLHVGSEADQDLVRALKIKFNGFIDALMSKPELSHEPLSRINLVSESELALLEKINTKRESYPGVSVCELFFQVAASQPEAIAAIVDGHSYTYAELSTKVDSIAGFLVKSGVGSGDRVGVLLHRSFEMLAALLAVMRVGAIYIPLDPIYPCNRLQHMVDDSAIKALISTSNINSGLISKAFIEVLLDSHAELIDESTANQHDFPRLDDSAYIIYTSGSTGKPKGVEITHKGLTNFMWAMAKEPGINVNDHLLSVTTVCFDIAALELYLPLIVGARVEICSAEDAKDGLALLEKLEKGSVSIMQATPATWEMLLAAGWDEPITLKVLCGGEPLRNELAAQLLPICSELWNMYGPTETTIWSSLKHIVDAEAISVGFPIANTSLHVLDKYHNPVSISEKGELYIGGDGLAKGYWSRKELTADKFIANPFSNDPMDRLYHTGDAACYLPSGELMCLGRIDNQVKLNGYRIELGEIETAIESFPEIEKSILVINSEGNSALLHAFLLSKNDCDIPSKDKIKNQLSERLPNYMIPDHYHQVAKFPLTLNGKVDRKPLIDSIGNLSEKEQGLSQGGVDGASDDSPSQRKLSEAGEVGTKSSGMDSSVRAQLTELFKKDFIGLVQDVLDESSVDEDLPFGNYGFNSLRFTMLSVSLRKRFSIKLSPAIYYGHDTINKMCDYLIGGKFKELFLSYYQGQIDLSGSSANVVQNDSDVDLAHSSKSGAVSDKTYKEPLAIVGLSLKMPESSNSDEFWEHLEQAKDCITEIPLSRWDWRSISEEGDKNPYRWGGFIPDVDCFDASFFSISPREAQLMDPQQRLFLQAVYHAMEDAGYNPESLSGKNIGVYVGTVTSDYWDLLQKQGVNPDGYTISGNINCVIANRISFYFNFTGPSAVIDTACSSSLVALHRAAKAVQSGECESAIVGGVNVIASPYIHHSFSKNGMLSKSGRCMSFDGRANGYVRSEGVTALMIKPLSKAIEDGDHIYAKVLGSAENHGGRTNSLSAPSSEAQAKLIIKAVRDADIDVNSLDYIEAHGSGTPLGDPIEIEGIQRAFEHLREKHDMPVSQCGIGSVKSNIGHLEAVAGLAGVAKVLLSFKNKKLPGMPLFQQQNDHIELDGSGLYFVDKGQHWPEKQGIDLRAGVSSFGFGGVNAHVILEDGTVENQTDIPSSNDNNVLLISARSSDQLKSLAADYLDHFRKNDELDWQGVCFTSQVGRQSFDERLYLEANSLQQAEVLLEAYIHETKISGKLQVGNIRETAKSRRQIFGDLDTSMMLQPLFEQQAMSSLARLWLAGVQVDWRRAYGDQGPQRQILPHYPFLKKQHWLPTSQKNGELDLMARGVEMTEAALHPLVDDQLLSEGRFKKHLHVNNPLIGDHIVDSKVVFPAVGYLEFARAAGDLFAKENLQRPSQVVSLEGNVWFHALLVDDKPRQLEVELTEQSERLQYSIRSISTAGEQVHARGSLRLSESSTPPNIVDMDEVAARCSNRLDHAEIYKLFSNLKFEYKDGYKPLQSVVFNKQEALAEIQLPEKFHDHHDEFVLHPSLLEGGIQTVIGILANSDQDSTSAYLPFSMKALKVHGSLSKQCRVHAIIISDVASAERGIRKFNINVTDSKGRLLVEIQEYVLKTLIADNGSNSKFTNTSDFGEYCKHWQPAPLFEQEQAPKSALIFSPNQEFTESASKVMAHSTACITVTAAASFQKLSANHFNLDPLVEDHISELFESLIRDDCLPTHILYAWPCTQLSPSENTQSDVLARVVKPFYRLCSEIAKQPQAGVQRLIYAYQTGTSQAPLHGGVSGLARSLHQELSRLKAAVVGVDTRLTERISDLTKELNRPNSEIEVRYLAGERQIATYEYMGQQPLEQVSSAFRQDNAYLITGATGAIGQRLVQYLKHRKVKLILLGRSPLSEALKVKWRDIDYSYYQTDIISPYVLEILVKEIITRQKISGVVHCAGGIVDDLIARKSAQDIDAVIEPKVLGTYSLDYATRQCDLDFFCVFSSISSVMGNIGQTDYGYANAVVDEFSEHRLALVERGLRKGRSLSINWPLWKEGGMSASDAAVKFFQDATGVVPLETDDGLHILETALQDMEGACIIVSGDHRKIESTLNKRSGNFSISKQTDISAPSSDKKITEDQSGGVILTPSQSLEIEALQIKLCDLAAITLKLNVADVDAAAPMAEMGFDSISNTELTTAINQFYGTDLTPIVFFECSTLQEVAEYMADEFSGLVSDKHSPPPSERDAPLTDSSSSIDSTLPALGSINIYNWLGNELRQMAATIVKSDPESIDLSANLSEYGFDSISNTELATEINQKLNLDVSPIIFFEHSGLDELTTHLSEEYGDHLRSLCADSARAQPTVELSQSSPDSYQVVESEVPLSPASVSQESAMKAVPYSNPSADIAIVGMKALMPASTDLDNFWQGLCDGTDFVSEVPDERWSWREIFGDAKEDPSRTKSKWGAFLPEIDKFDAEFFSIESKDAELLDPQQRLFLQMVWHVIEDAGYKASDLAGTKTGVYGGVSNRDYADYLQRIGEVLSPDHSFGNNNAFLVNRISYLMNFTGPSEPVDTLCSSSLVAVHRAAQDLREGLCDQAIVGGISLIISPKLSVVFEQADMLSADGRCKSFDESADGFVRGEGGAVLMLKTREHAERDGDNILALIKGSYVNHGGRANALTAPSLNAQSQLIEAAYRRSGLHPETVSYIEAHGTGTKLGDPIEIGAIKKAFKEWKGIASGVAEPNCGIGSVKSNIGHLESASGMASIVKVLLSMRNKSLPGLVHMKAANPYIDLKGSSLYLQVDNQYWEPLLNLSGQAFPRRAGINAFGAGGVNAHVILEEYIPENDTASEQTQSQLIVISAKKESTLRQYAGDLSKGILSNRGENSPKLSDIAYTLQIGREAFDYRVAVVANSLDELAEQLAEFSKGGYAEDVKFRKVDESLIGVTNSERTEALRNRDLDAVIRYWLAGEVLQWELLYDNESVKKCSLPTYPFDRVSHWRNPLPDEETISISKKIPTGKTHAITQQENFGIEKKPKSALSYYDFAQGEMYLADHKVFSEEVLLGVTYPSLALEVIRSKKQWSNVNRVSRLVFHNPLALIEGERSRVVVKTTDSDSSVGFETFHQIYGKYATEKSSVGSISRSPIHHKKIDLDNLVRGLCKKVDRETIYSLLRTQNVDYQRSLKTVNNLFFGEKVAIGQVHLNENLKSNMTDFYLHPVWLDAAVVCAKYAFLQNPEIIYIPFSIEDIVVIKRPESISNYCVVTKALLNDQILKCDVDICDSHGVVLVEAKGLSCKRVKSLKSLKKNVTTSEAQI